MDYMARPASGFSSRCFIEPIHLKTLPQCHSRSMQHYPEIAVADREDRANLSARHAIHFAHGKNGTDFFRQFRKAVSHYLPELGTMHHLIRLRFPLVWTEIVVPKADRHEFLRKFTRKKFHVGKRCFSPHLPEMIHNLVF